MVQPGAPLSTVQYWLEAQLVPQLGCVQVVPFQPGRQAVQVLASLQDAQLAGQATQTPEEQYWLAAQLVQAWESAGPVLYGRKRAQRYMAQAPTPVSAVIWTLR